LEFPLLASKDVGPLLDQADFRDGSIATDRASNESGHIRYAAESRSKFSEPAKLAAALSYEHFMQHFR
jgi:hypothetical protein